MEDLNQLKQGSQAISKIQNVVETGSSSLDSNLKMDVSTIDIDTFFSGEELQPLREHLQSAFSAMESQNTTNPLLSDSVFICLDSLYDHSVIVTMVQKLYDMIIQNPSQKVVLVGFERISDILERYKNSMGLQMGYILSRPQTQFLQLPFSLEIMKNIRFDKPIISISNEQKHQGRIKIGTDKISRLRHDIGGIANPYKPVTEWEKSILDKAFTLGKQYFPGLDTVEKMLDFILHVDVDIPEVMKGKEIMGVYADIDGTVIEYVPIGSEKEGQQQLRHEVIELLESYEKQGKTITLWTGGDVDQKQSYLQSLGVKRPVVSKYDYAGATAEIVVDDTDEEAFITQSKIKAEKYIDTRHMNI